ncbi:MAG: Hsp20/alpha crystallin family protein [Elusimicrobia bacterium]|nr:Hsp20/alpha crystallin family protein [Elusimicrobiota bacterium]
MANLLKLEPHRDFWGIQDIFDNFIGRHWADKKLGEAILSPKIELQDKKDAITIRAEIPGVDKKDIKLTLDHGNLIVSGETKKEEETNKKDYYYSERTYGSFYRSIPLPVDVDEKTVKANYKDGILNITLPKTKEAKEKLKEITIE